MIELTQANLDKCLKEWKLEPKYQKETGQTYVELKIKEFDVPVFFGFVSEDTVLQLIAYLPYNLKPNTTADVARLFHQLNMQLDMPGFGMDEKAGLLFYRLVIPTLEKKFDPNVLNAYLGAVQGACGAFMQAISMIVSGTVTLEKLNENG